jgi:4-diphosphocytidyl-2-C-methyl-D-erythritol kinase
LEVIGKRADGYHDVRTVLQTVNLFDDIEIEHAGELTLTVEPASAVPIDGNLVLHAAHMLRQAVGEARGAAITLRKRIPVAAGLGGGSTDAAATLLGLRELWSLDISDAALAAMAALLGSDVPFFLRGGTTLGTGRGDELRPLSMPVESLAVIVTPQEPEEATKTARLYGMLRPEHFSDGGKTDEVVRRIEADEPLGNAPYSTFAQVAFSAYASYELACTILRTTRAEHTLLCGAGPSLITLVDDAAVAESIRDCMLGEGHVVHVAKLTPASEKPS